MQTAILFPKKLLPYSLPYSEISVEQLSLRESTMHTKIVRDIQIQIWKPREASFRLQNDAQDMT